MSPSRMSKFLDVPQFFFSFFLSNRERERERRGRRKKDETPCGLKATKHVRKTLARILIDTRQ